MYRISCILLLLYASVTVYAQGENNVWTFGINGGLDFNSGKPVFFTSQSQTNEGCASFSRPDGSLLFYSDGSHVWDRNHALMPNGTDLLGNKGAYAGSYGSATQGVAIVPFIDDTNKYYLFTVDCAENTFNVPGSMGYLRYSVIDMSLNSGWGDVMPAQKNITIDSGKSEKMTVAKGRGCFFWLVTHQYGSDEFRTYKISSSGISAPVSSFACSVDKSLMHPAHSYMVGEIKVSPDSKMVAIVNNWPRTVEMFAFDNSSGMVSAPFTIYETTDIVFLYGISFSPDNSKFYISRSDSWGDGKYKLLQADLSYMPDVTAVKKSLTEIGDKSDWGGMRLAPDHKIYISGIKNNLLYAIEYPDLKADACSVQSVGFYTPDNVHFQLGLGNAVYTLNDLKQDNDVVGLQWCDLQGQKAVLHAREWYADYRWNNGTTDEYYVPDSAGIYWVRGDNECGTVTDTFIVTNNCDKCIFMPSAFTPDNDGINDCFRAVGTDIAIDVFEVYNRWGKRVFSAANGIYCWDGTCKGTRCDIGTYYYFIKGKCRDDKHFSDKGAVTLLR